MCRVNFSFVGHVLFNECSLIGVSVCRFWMCRKRLGQLSERYTPASSLFTVCINMWCVMCVSLCVYAVTAMCWTGLRSVLPL